MKKGYISSSAARTKQLGKSLAEEIINFVKNPRDRGKGKKEGVYGRAEKNSREKAFVIALDGELGGGKTTFLQGFARGLGVEEKILSPTFVILKKFQLINNLTIKQFNNFYHIDCYRIQNPEELIGLGFKEIVKNPENIVAVEWAERIKKTIPKDALKLKFKFIDEKTRRIEVEGGK
jgi:tRNA threonylcarbamoyladenosine biosynthesis protein TsaE